jgi:hypothetical protein
MHCATRISVKHSNTIRATHRLMTRHFSHFCNPIAWRDWLLAATLAVICCIAFPATLSAQDIHDDDEFRAAREHGQNATGLRTANCLIKVQGIEYVRGFCAFIPSDKKDGSFVIAGHVQKRFLEAKVILSAPASKDAVAYWSGPNGERLVELGLAHSEGACWRVGDAKGKDETRLCAWNSLAVDQPTPKEPPQIRRTLFIMECGSACTTQLVRESE